MKTRTDTPGRAQPDDRDQEATHGSTTATAGGRRRLGLPHWFAAVMLGANLVQGQVSDSALLAFHPAADGSFTFDTGSLRGVLRAEGKSLGLQSVTHVPSGRRLDSSNGLLSHYRVFTVGKRYGGGAWDWPSTARLTARGAVEVIWPASEERPFEMRAIYRWTTPTTLDLETRVEAKQAVTRFECFLASYFTGGFTNAMAAAGSGTGSGESATFLRADRAGGEWQMFPRDGEAVRTIQDGRWALLPHPVDWAIRPRLVYPVAVRCDQVGGLAALVMGRPDECFAVAMPHETEGHYSVYLSQFGRDLKAGEVASARARLVILDTLDPERFGRVWDEFAETSMELQ